MIRLISAASILFLWLPAFLAVPAAQSQIVTKDSAKPIVTVQVSVSAVSPGSVNLAPRGKKTVTISGGGLNVPGLSLKVRKKGGSSENVKVTATLGTVSGASARGMTVKATKGADPGEYKVVLKGPNTDLTLPLTVTVSTVKMSSQVSSSQPVVTAEPAETSPEAVQKTGAKDLQAKASRKPAASGLLAKPPPSTARAVKAAPSPGMAIPEAPAAEGGSSGFGTRATAMSPSLKALAPVLSPAQVQARKAKLKKEIAVLQKKAKQDFLVRKEKYEREQEARWNAEDEKARAEMKKLAGRAVMVEADGDPKLRIQAEAVQLYRKSQNASPAEKAALNRRAKELYQELRGLEVSQ